MDIQLRNLMIEDLEQMVQWEQNEDPLFFDYNFPRYNKKEQNIWFNSKTKYGKTCLVIVCKDEVIGYIAIRKLNPITRSAEMGVIMRPSFQNKGIGTAAISKMLDWFFHELDYRKMSLYVGRYNRKALKCYRKLGFRPVKELLLTFGNKEVNLNSKKYDELKEYFVMENDKVSMLCYKMVLEKSAK